MVVSMATTYTNDVCVHVKQNKKKKRDDFSFCAPKMFSPSRYEHGLPHTLTLEKVYISKRRNWGKKKKKKKTTKTDFDRLKHFGLLFRRLTSLLRGFLWSCPQKTLMPGPKFPL